MSSVPRDAALVAYGEGSSDTRRRGRGRSRGFAVSSLAAPPGGPASGASSKTWKSRPVRAGRERGRRAVSQDPHAGELDLSVTPQLEEAIERFDGELTVKSLRPATSSTPPGSLCSPAYTEKGAHRRVESPSTARPTRCSAFSPSPACSATASSSRTTGCPVCLRSVRLDGLRAAQAVQFSTGAGTEPCGQARSNSPFIGG
jgi:hypothetical protein